MSRPISDAEGDVLRAAHGWWMKQKPLALTYAEHLANPEVNCTTPFEQELARAVAKLVEWRERDRA